MIEQADSKLIEKYADYYKTEKKGEAYELVGIDNYLYPYYKVRLKCVYKKKSPISIAEEFFLRAIHAGIKSIETLQLFLGLDDPVFEDVYSEMHQKNYCNKNPHLHITSSGLEFLHEMGHDEFITEEKKVYIDGITEDIQFDDIQATRYHERMDKLKPAIPYPRPENLDYFYRSIFAFLKDEASEEEKSGKNKPVLFEIKEIKDNAAKFDQKRTILFYRNTANENDWKILVLSDGKENLKATNDILQKELNGKRILTFPKRKNGTEEDHKSVEKPETLITVKHISDVDHLEDEAFLKTSSHPVLLEKALKEATDSIVINSPWIRNEVVDGNFKKNLEEALKRDVVITINYGMGTGGRQSKPDIDPSSDNHFKHLQKKFKKNLILNKMQGNHGKVLICDDRFMVTTSFNWLSFRGDPNRELRFEFGTFSRNKKLINETRTHLLNLT